MYILLSNAFCVLSYGYNMKISNVVKLNIIKDYNNSGLKCVDLAKKYNVSKSFISNLMKKNGISINVKFDKNQEKEILNKYKNGVNVKKLSIEYGVKEYRILYILNKMNVQISKRKYKLNENYFDSIDTEKKAYFLGLLYADGCNSNNSITIGLQTLDKNILEIFKNDIKTDINIKVEKISEKYPSRQDRCILYLNSKKLCSKLTNLGCFPRKSLILKFPKETQVPKNLLKHFIRGYFDGDGCVSLIKSGGKYLDMFVNICSSLEFCESLKTFIESELNINCGIYKLNKKSNKNTRQLKIGGTQQSYKFLNWLYKESSVYLDRKYDKFKNFYKTLLDNGHKLND